MREPSFRGFLWSLFLFHSLAGAQTSAAQSQFTCGDVVQPPGVSSVDALASLQTAVQLRQCSPCQCDADGSGHVTATDALLVLKKAVGQPVTMGCPFCCVECDCTPQTLTLTLSDVAPCEGCIPRVPPSNTTIDGITIEFADGLNDSYELASVAECVWQASVPGVIVQKTFYGNSTCGVSASPQGSFPIELRVVRTADGWEIYAGQYALSLEWGDAIRASVESASCDAGGSASSQNQACELAEIGNPDDYDIHATGGSAMLEVSDPEPACTEAAP